MYIITFYAMEWRISVDITSTSVWKKAFYFHQWRKILYLRNELLNPNYMQWSRSRRIFITELLLANVILVHAIMVMQRQTTSRKPYICATYYIRKMSCNGNLSVSHNMKKKNCTFSLTQKDVHPSFHLLEYSRCLVSYSNLVSLSRFI